MLSSSKCLQCSDLILFVYLEYSIRDFLSVIIFPYNLNYVPGSYQYQFSLNQSKAQYEKITSSCVLLIAIGFGVNILSIWRIKMKYTRDNIFWIWLNLSQNLWAIYVDLNCFRSNVFMLLAGRLKWVVGWPFTTLIEISRSKLNTISSLVFLRQRDAANLTRIPFFVHLWHIRKLERWMLQSKTCFNI